MQSEQHLLSQVKDILPRLNPTPAGQIDSLIPKAKLSMSSCSNLFKTLSPIFSFTMGLAGRLQLSVSKCAQNFGHYHAAGQNKRTFKLKLFWIAVCLLICLLPFLDKTWRLWRGAPGAVIFMRGTPFYSSQMSGFHNAKSSDPILVLYCNGSFYLFLLLLPDWRSSLLSSSELSEKGLRIMLLTLLQDKFFIKNLSFFLTKAKDSSIV